MKGLFIGLCTVDIQYLLQEYPKSNTKNRALQDDISTGGPALNAAVAFAFLGGEALLYTKIGKNAFSRFCKDDLHTYKISFKDFVPESTKNLVFSSIVSDAECGDRTIFNSRNHFPETNIKLKLPDDIDFVFTDGFYPDISLPILTEARERNISVIVDGGSWKPQMSMILSLTNIAICSSDFYPPETKVTDEVFKFIKGKHVEQIAISRGDQSILIYDRDEKYEIPVKQSDIVCDTLGAGDVLHGAFCFFYHNGYDFKDAMQIASKVASFSCDFLGSRKWMKHFNIQEINKILNSIK